MFPVRLVRPAVITLLGVIALTGYHRAAHFDDAWFAEQSYWLVKTGWVRSEFFRGYNGWGDRIYVFHKLFVYAGALVMGMAGFTLPVSKVLTAFCAGLTGWLLWRLLLRKTADERWLALLLYFGCGSVIQYSFVNRPELMCMTLGFGSFVMLEQSNGSRAKASLSGFLAGLAALTHLNGLIYLLAGASWLLLRVGWRTAFWFSLVGGLTLSLYFLDALTDGNMTGLLAQFRNDPATQTNFQLTDKLLLMLQYHQLFFHSDGEVPLTVLVSLCLLTFWRRLRWSQPVLLYLTLLAGFFWLLAKSYFEFYYLLFVPWLVLLVAHCLTVYLPFVAKDWQTATKYLTAGYVGFSIFVAGSVLIENHTQPHVVSYNAELARQMPRQGTKIIAPISFFWGQHANYRIHGLTVFLLIERRASPIPLTTFFQQASQDGVQYIVSDGFKNASYEIPLTAPARIGAYQRTFTDGRTVIYTHR